MHSRVVVLGGGPGGYAAAFLAADQGLDVTLVESEPRLGGTCLLHGCIPSKALLHVAQMISQVDELSQQWGIEYSQPAIDLDQVRNRKESIIEALAGGLAQIAKRRNVHVIQATGSFIDSTTLQLTGADESIATEKTLTFDHCILATGSRAAIPSVWKSDSPRVMTSDQALQLTDVPSSLLVIGGGYIGLELGSVYARLGSNVHVVEMAEQLLVDADKDLVKPLYQKLNQLFSGGIELNTQITSITPQSNHVDVEYQTPDGSQSKSFDRVLVAVGRQPNSAGIGLEHTAVELDDAGFVQCDSGQLTSDPHILAIGDVCGHPMLAHKATSDARMAVKTLIVDSNDPLSGCIPAVIFTDPEIAWAGLTETAAQRDHIDYQVAIYPWAASGRAQAIGRNEGRTKWLIDPQTNRLLGCGMVGPGAGELIATAVTAIDQNWTVEQITESIAPHPTLSETLSGAAEVFLGEAIEIYKPKRAR